MRRFMFVVLALLLGMLAHKPALAQTRPVKNITVLANFAFSGRHSPFFVALDKGYLKEAGFNANIQPAAGSGFVISAVESGKADYGLADAGTVVQAIAKGAKVKGYQVFVDVVTEGLVALKPYPTPASVLGKSIAASATDAARTILPIILKTKGLDASKLHWIAASPATHFTLLLSGQTDIVTATIDGDMPPLTNIAEKQGKKVYFSSFSGWGYDVLGLIFIANASSLEKNPDEVKRFAAAMKKAVEFSIKHPEDAARIMVKYNPTRKYDVTLAQWKQSIKAIATPYMKAHGFGVATPDRVERTIGLVKDAFTLKTNLKPDDVWMFGVATN
ncbi:MAG: ABC transporter substrate-binding protein [Terriglobia bacterium]